jgi:hypothetical protein
MASGVNPQFHVAGIEPMQLVLHKVFAHKSICDFKNERASSVLSRLGDHHLAAIRAR